MQNTHEMQDLTDTRRRVSGWLLTVIVVLVVAALSLDLLFWTGVIHRPSNIRVANTDRAQASSLVPLRKTVEERRRFLEDRIDNLDQQLDRLIAHQGRLEEAIAMSEDSATTAILMQVVNDVQQRRVDVSTDKTALQLELRSLDEST